MQGWGFDRLGSKFNNDALIIGLFPYQIFRIMNVM